MPDEIIILSFTAASIAFLHTLLGPDHYLPFVVMAKARRWSIVKTAMITFLCGAGHVAGSVILGLIGISLGLAVDGLIEIESFRGIVAAWLLITFGLIYFVWGLRKAVRKVPHNHFHSHENGIHHSHYHHHHKDHVHAHTQEKSNLTPWVLFTVFILGPCEPLIPLLIYPAAKSSYLGVVWVTFVFGAVTIVTMCAFVLVSSFGIKFLNLGRFEKYSHSMAGASICLSGLAIHFLGL
ncbi:MAG: sulfite exporter TauE/SafE family protein [Deltaproteobacteria bacterium]|nr:sulfite exporter TauE/SafE family protein [Deltaproteobacteria bacterium]